MSLPTRTASSRRLASLVCFMGCVLWAALAHAAVDFRQSANNDSPHPLGNVHWIGSILQQQNSRYVEGMSTLQRLFVTAIVPKAGPDPNTHTLTFRHQSSKGSAGSHCYDYLTSWDQAVAAANAYAVGQGLLSTLNICGDELGPPASLTATCTALHASGNTATLDAPDAMGTLLGHSIAASVSAYETRFGNRTIKVYAKSTASALTGVSLVFNGYTGGSDQDAQYTLTWTSNSDEILIEFAGHLASGLDPVSAAIGYGAGTGSSSVSGGPYHIPLDLLDGGDHGGSLGNQDNQIKGADIILPCPEVAAGPDKELNCAVTQINLSGSSITPGAIFSWVASAGGHIVSGANTATPLVDAAGTYTLTVSVTGNPCTASEVALVTANTTPPDVHAGADGVIDCLTGPTITLHGSSSTLNATFAWVASAGGNIVSGANTADPVVNAAGTYTLTVTDPLNHCTAPDVALVTLNTTPPDVHAGADGVIDCLTGPTITLHGSSSTLNAAFAWVASAGGNIVSGANTADPVVNAAGTYTLTVTDPLNHCTAPDVALVTLNTTPPDVHAGADGVIDCLTGPTITLHGSSSTLNAAFAWVASAGGNIVSGANTADPVVNAAGTYTLTVTDPLNHCTAPDVALVTLNTTPPDVHAGADGVIDCLTGPTITLHGSSSTLNATFAWVASAGGNIVSGANTADPVVNAAGTYTLTVTDPLNHCTAPDVALVTLNTTPPDVHAGADGVIDCLTGPTITLHGSSSTLNATFAWVASAGGNIVSGANTADPVVDAAGTYTLTVTDPLNHCTAPDVALVTLNTTPPDVHAGADGVIDCLTGPTITLHGSSSTLNATFAWVGSAGGNIVSGANTADPVVNAAGTYTLTVTDPLNHCTAPDVALVTLNTTPPDVHAGADGVIDCLTGPTITLHGSSSTLNATFAWVGSAGGNIVSGANTADPVVDAAGTYTLTVTDPLSHCTAPDVALVTLNTTPPDVHAGADGVIDCLTGPTITLHGSSSTLNATFAWVASAGGNIVSGANTADPVVNAAGTYTLTVTDPLNHCTAPDVALVTLNTTPPDVHAGADGVIDCLTGPTITLHGSSSTLNATFAWVASAGGNIVSGANTADPVVDAAGTYTLTVTDPLNHCTAPDVAAVTLNSTPPDVHAGADGVLSCSVLQVTLTGSSSTSGATFSWVASNGGHIVSGANTATPLVDAVGTYTLTVTDPFNHCTAPDVALVTLDPTPCAGEGCTPGFWCGGAGSQYWDVGADGQWTVACGGANPFKSSDPFCGAPLSLFNCHPDVQGKTMSDLLCTGGGKIWAQKAARDVIAAYLNASCDGVAFGMQPSAVAQMWNDAVAGVITFQTLHNTLSALNDPPGDDDCPLGRVRAAVPTDPVNSEATPEPETAGPKLELYRPTPNPFASAARLAYEVASNSESVEIGVYDVAGRHIRGLVSGIMPAGRYETRWDGLNDAGARVTHGLYFIRISVGQQHRTVPVVFVR